MELIQKNMSGGGALFIESFICSALCYCRHYSHFKDEKIEIL